MATRTERKATKGFRFHVVCLTGALVGLSLVLGSTPIHGQAPKAAIDLNNGSEKELESIKGVGPATAKKIIAGRPYKSVDDLSKAGIPAKTVEGIKPFVKVGPASATAAPAEPGKVPAAKAAPGPAPSPPAARKSSPAPEAKAVPVPAKLAPGQKVNINAASKEQLEALPGIGPVKAQAIIDGRPYKKPEDIMKVKGIKQGIFNKIKDVIATE